MKFAESEKENAAQVVPVLSGGMLRLLAGGYIQLAWAINKAALEFARVCLGLVPFRLSK